MTNYEKLRATLREVFMLDKAELDFGIYRILNQKRQEIERFLDDDLLPQVRSVLGAHAGTGREQVQHDLDKVLAGLKEMGVPNPDSVQKVVDLREKLAAFGDAESLENDIFSRLANFFSRYYDNGDFISQRRYKRDVYAIPYEGEEVKLHWANHDQYYIKTAEYFRSYRFQLPASAGGKFVVFELIEATTEQHNNKLQGKQERRFALYKADPVAVVNDELCLRFVYEPVPKTVKQVELLRQAFEAIHPLLPEPFAKALLAPIEPKAKSPVGLLEKHLTDYSARNTFDYFIHKDLGRFLSHELDFYIKNEVIYLDDLNTANEQDTLRELSKVKALRTIGQKIIRFLAQLEDFQKKLWLKKKFVVESNYCFTLDRIPTTFYEEIATNTAQTEEWVRLFAIDAIQADTVTEGFSQPVSIRFLEQNPHLLIDTAFFPEDFKFRLLAEIKDVAQALDGLLVSSENFQALNLLKERYTGQMDCIYIDPPYNTDAGPIMYKNGYKSSSWAALMDNRIEVSKSLLTEKGVIAAAIDDAQQRELSYILASHYGGNLLGTFCVRSNPSGRPTQAGYAVSHEYVLFAGKSDSSGINRMPPTPEQMARFNKEDEEGVFEWRNLRREGSNSDRDARRALYYPIYIAGESIRVPELEWDEVNETWIIKEEPKKGEQVVYPNNDEGAEKTWRWEWKTVMTSLEKVAVRPDRTGKDYIYYKRRPNEAGVVSVSSWFDAKYSATEHGTALLKALFGKSPFTYPKSLYAVMDSVYIGGGSHPKANVIDFFGGSATTAHAVMNLNREDQGHRKYILVEMGEYFDTVTKPRVMKAAYSKNWKDGKPVGRNTGLSHAFQHIRLESYEDTLNNLLLLPAEGRPEAQRLALDANPAFREEYLLGYMLDVESRQSLLNLEWFNAPFDCKLKVTRQNEERETTVDLVETFNFLLGLVVEHHSAPEPGFRLMRGRTRATGEAVLVVWRDTRVHDHKALNDFLAASPHSPLRHAYATVYVNGSHTVPTMPGIPAAGTWQVRQIEEEFGKRMFAQTD